MIFLSVGTFVHGFDELVDAADIAAAELQIKGFAQIGHSGVQPRHLTWQRFMSQSEMRQSLDKARLVICHGGAGILGDAMRAGRPILAVPRRGATSKNHPANDQTEFVRLIAQHYGIRVCEDLARFTPALRHALSTTRAPQSYKVGSNIPQLIGTFLEQTTRPKKILEPRAQRSPSRS